MITTLVSNTSVRLDIASQGYTRTADNKNLNGLLELGGRTLLVLAPTVAIVVAHNLLDSEHSLVGEVLVLEHWDILVSVHGKQHGYRVDNLLKASSSRVRPKVSGKKK